MLNQKLMLIVAALIGPMFLYACSPPRDISANILPHEVPLEDIETYLLLADSAINQHNFREGKRILEKILRQEPANVKARLILANMHFHQGKMDLSTVAYQELIEIDEIKAEAYQGYGLSLLKKGALEEASVSLKNAVKYDHTLWRAWNALGYYYDKQENWKQAKSSYDMALRFNAKSSMLYNNRGFSLILQNQTKLAVEDLTKAVLYDPENKFAQTNLQIALSFEGNYRKAVALSDNNSKPSSLNNAGYIAILNGDFESAEKLLNMAMKNAYSFNEKAWKNIDFLKSLKQIKGGQKVF